MAKTAKAGWISEQICVQAAGTCNLYCACCQNPPDGKIPTLARALAAVKRRGIKAVSLEGGGEPTTNPDFFETIEKLRAAGVEHFMLSTNAVALADRAFCARAAAEIDQFTVNFPSHLPAVYARATRSVKFPLALRGLKNLKVCGAEDRLRLFHIVSAANFKALPAFADWVAANFGRAALVNLTFVRNAGRVQDNPAIVPSYTEAAPFIKITLAKFKLALRGDAKGSGLQLDQAIKRDMLPGREALASAIAAIALGDRRAAAEDLRAFSTVSGGGMFYRLAVSAAQALEEDGVKAEGTSARR